MSDAKGQSCSSRGLDRRSLLAAAVGAGTAAWAATRPTAALASHSSSPHIIDVVDDFKAAGDGSPGDAERIQEAIDSLPDATGGTVFFPPGRYRLEDSAGNPQPLEVRGPKQLVGAGARASRLLYTGPGAALRVNPGTGLRTRHLVLRDLALIGEDSGETGLEIGGAPSGVRSASGLFENVYVARFVSAGVRVLASVGSTFLRLWAEHNGQGVVLDPTDEGFSNGNEFFGCRIITNERQGVKIEGRNNNAFYGCIFEANGEEGVWIESQQERIEISAASFYNCFFEDNNCNFVNQICQRRPGDGHASLRVEGTGTLRSLVVINTTFNASGPENVHLRLDGHLEGGQIGPNAYRGGRRSDAEIGATASGSLVVVGADPAGWQVDPDSAIQITWIGGLSGDQGPSGVGIGTPQPPTDVNLWIGGRSRFDTVGQGLIGRGETAVAVADDRIGPDSHVTVTLNGDPGNGRIVRWVKNRHADSAPGFTVVLNLPALADTSFTYFIVN